MIEQSRISVNILKPFVDCYASIIHISAHLSIAFSIKSEKKSKKIAVDFAEKNRYVLPLFFFIVGVLYLHEEK